ncbi:flagellar export protein FliJ [Paramaledivibacter caminithermalis]|uniref:Flagellar FliJ protein n=1 Tax=Paramaledivibacter caminithermalis (strain DSM 15212 / CIP 107654 / DViRD3) TaxID=1121301 RepID=A0A1M6N7Y9_PARC5|nr:flagellar export protein FliJ [Paramaledivibacter caminithermalis]SHJ91754.1 flagellar FliJ protein [Paramaledivibacter caminithermalis DSM 15212]
MMKGFKFKYESILNLAKKKEDALKTELGKAYDILNEEKNKLNALVMKDNEYLKIIKNKTSSGCKLITLINIEDYRKDLNMNIAFQNNIIYMKKKEIESIKNQLIEISKEKRIMEKLKEKKLEEFNMMLKKIEERNIDQLITYKNSLLHR